MPTRVPQNPERERTRSITHDRLITTLESLDSTLQRLERIVSTLEEHELVSLYRSRWKLILHQIMLGMAFAIGTVLGLALLSWFTYNFFKDSDILRQIVDKQLNIREFDVSGIQEHAVDTFAKPYTTINRILSEHTGQGSRAMSASGVSSGETIAPSESATPPSEVR